MFSRQRIRWCLNYLQWIVQGMQGQVRKSTPPEPVSETLFSSPDFPLASEYPTPPAATLPSPDFPLASSPSCCPSSSFSRWGWASIKMLIMSMDAFQSIPDQFRPSGALLKYLKGSTQHAQELRRN